MTNIDKTHIWHPYSAMDSQIPVYEVASANGVRIKLKNGQVLLDGMASWWCAIHGYNHPVLNEALAHAIRFDGTRHVRWLYASACN